MSDGDEYRCFVGSLSWYTTEVGLKDAFGKFGRLTETKVVIDKFSGRSRGFGFVTFDDKRAMEEAIEAMNGMDLDGRNITVERAQPQPSGRDRDGDRDYSRGGGDRYRGDYGRGGGDRDYYRGDYGRGGGDRDHYRADYGRDRDFGGGRGGGGGDCFKCGKPGHFARECPSGDYGRDDRYGSREDRYDGGYGSSRYGPDRSGDRYSGSRDGGSRYGGGGDRYNRDRSGPYERPSRGGYRS